MALAVAARVTVPVTASAALGPVLACPAEGALLGAGESGAWARLRDTVVALLPAGTRRAPHGIEVPRALLLQVEPGAACRADDGRFEVGGWRLEVRGSWDPRPRLPRIPRGVPGAAAAALPPSPVGDCGLGGILVARDRRRFLAVAGHLLGRGPGLTPLGDDVLVGALAGSRLLGEAAGDLPLARLAEEVAAPLEALARERTTLLSATLLRHACRGEVDDAAAALLHDLCGRGDPAAAFDALLAVGHTSGHGLAAGILAAAAAVGGAG
jgi:hypothetical protein